ncbi:DUF5808 domain-containing protein [Paenibacillus aurantiacus]|uniref:DUF5808 domain-containing protein n=1 Tax=Paenibacillus aurantiacus TaxID=1936118 RepID=A0ABV5KVH2_9BACL
MLTIILLVNALICYVALTGAYKTQASFKNGMLFAVSLPPAAKEDAEVKAVQLAFYRRFRTYSLWLAVGFAPVALLIPWTAYQVVYFLLWIGVFMAAMVMPFRQAFRDTLALKRRNDWFVGAKRAIQSDLRAARLKNGRSAPLWLFAVPFIIGTGALIHAMRTNSQLIALASIGIVATLIMIAIALQMRRSKAKVYSMNSDTNVLLNQERRRTLSYLWLNLAVVESVHGWIIYLLIAANRVGDWWVALMLLFAAIPLALTYAAYRKLRRLEHDILVNDGSLVYTDDDEYWGNGFTYHNPDDRRVFVEKRIGVGFTVNTGTPVGKALAWGTAGLTAAVILVVSFMLIRAELTSPVMTITADQRVEIAYPMYSYDFKLSDVEQLELVDDVPDGMKTNGEATGRFSRGHFRLNGLGKARLYVFNDNPPYIRMKLNDTYIYYNEEDPARTKAQFDELKGEAGG